MAKRFSESTGRRSWQQSRQANTVSGNAVQGFALLLGIAMILVLVWAVREFYLRAPGEVHFLAVAPDLSTLDTHQVPLYSQQDLDAWSPWTGRANPISLSDLPHWETGSRDTVVVYCKSALLARSDPSGETTHLGWTADKRDLQHDLLQVLADMPGKLKLLVLDGSYESSRPDQGRLANAWSTTLAGALGQMDAESSVWVLCDASPGQVAHLRHDRQRSVFGWAVTDAFRGLADLPESENGLVGGNHDSRLDFGEFCQYVVARCRAETQRRQTPLLLKAGESEPSFEPEAYALCAVPDPDADEQDANADVDPEREGRAPTEGGSANSDAATEDSPKPVDETEPADDWDRLRDAWARRDQLAMDPQRAPVLYAPHLLRELDEYLIQATRRTLAGQTTDVESQFPLLKNWIDQQDVPPRGKPGIVSRLAAAERAYAKRRGVGLRVDAEVVEYYLGWSQVMDLLSTSLATGIGLDDLESLVDAQLVARGAPANPRDIERARSEQQRLCDQIQMRFVTRTTVPGTEEQPAGTAVTSSDHFSVLRCGKPSVRTQLLKAMEAARSEPAGPVLLAAVPAAQIDWQKTLQDEKAHTAQAERVFKTFCQLIGVALEQSTPSQLQNLYESMEAALADGSVQQTSLCWLFDASDTMRGAPKFVTAEVFLPFDQATKRVFQLDKELRAAIGASQNRPQLLAMREAARFPIRVETTDPNATRVPISIRFSKLLRVAVSPPSADDRRTDGQISFTLKSGQQRTLVVEPEGFRPDDADTRAVAILVDNSAPRTLKLRLPTKAQLQLTALRNGKDPRSDMARIEFRPFSQGSTEMTLRARNRSDDDTAFNAALYAWRDDGEPELLARAQTDTLAPGKEAELVFQLPEAAAPAPATGAETPAAAPPPAAGPDVRRGLLLDFNNGRWQHRIDLNYADPSRYLRDARVEFDGQSQEAVRAHVEIDPDRIPLGKEVPVELVVHNYQRVRAELVDRRPRVVLNAAQPSATMHLPVPPGLRKTVSLTVDGVPRTMLFESSGRVWRRLSRRPGRVEIGSIVLGELTYVTRKDLQFPSWSLAKIKRVPEPIFAYAEADRDILVHLQADFPPAGHQLNVSYLGEDGEIWDSRQVDSDRDVAMHFAGVTPAGGLLIHCQVADLVVPLRNDVQNGRGMIRAALVQGGQRRVRQDELAVVVDNESPRVQQMRAANRRVRLGNAVKVEFEVSDLAGIREIRYALAEKPGELKEDQGTAVTPKWARDAETARGEFYVPTKDFKVEEGQEVSAFVVMGVKDGAGRQVSDSLPVTIHHPQPAAGTRNAAGQPVGKVIVTVVFDSTGAALHGQFAENTKVTIKELDKTLALNPNAQCTFEEIPQPGSYTFVVETAAVTSFGEYAGELAGQTIKQDGQRVIVKVKRK